MSNISLRQIVIDDAARARAKQIMAYAALHGESLTDLRNRLASGMPMRDPEKYAMQVPVGYNIAYTIEQRSIGWVQRIAIFQATPRIMPHPPAVAAIVTELFGITAAKHPLPNGRGAGVLGEALEVTQQDLPNGCIAINLLYPYKFPES
jgi:hypothetical protein